MTQELKLLMDIRALLYLLALQAISQHSGVVLDQYSSNVDAMLEQIRVRLGG